LTNVDIAALPCGVHIPSRRILTPQVVVTPLLEPPVISSWAGTGLTARASEAPVSRCARASLIESPGNRL